MKWNVIYPQNNLKSENILYSQNNLKRENIIFPKQFKERKYNIPKTI